MGRMDQEALQRRYTKAVVAQWKACKAEEKARVSEQNAAAKAEKQVREREAHRKRQQELAAMLAQRRAATAQAHCAELHIYETTGMLQPQYHKNPRKGGSQKGRASRPLTAEKRQALAERNRKHIENRAAAVQAVKEQQARRANVQARLCTRVWKPCFASKPFLTHREWPACAVAMHVTVYQLLTVCTVAGFCQRRSGP